MIRLYNTMTREKEDFIPVREGHVTMYVCGPTVYNFIHIGNARVFVVFDTIRKYLEYRGYKVKYVQNFTDVDDKIIKRAKEEGTVMEEVSERFIKEYFEDADSLNIKRADVHPKVTEHIPDIIWYIERLIERGYAYEADGDVYFDVTKFKEYGKLSKRNTDELMAGARVEINENKRNPLDFALWKKQKPGEPGWDSPWSIGRPGWHIECSVMAMKYLGETIDIHAGGPDLIFPHHENEIAQSEAATGKPFAKYWLHIGYLNIDNEKMSKSLGNVLTVREARDKFTPDVIRFALLSSHYRSPINYTEELLKQSQNALERIYNGLNNLRHFEKITEDRVLSQNEEEILEKFINLRTKFIEAMDDDFNTAEAISVLFEVIKEANISINEKASKKLVQEVIKLIEEINGILGILSNQKEELLDEEIQRLIELRQQARREKNWALADKIRDELKEKGIILEDTPYGVRYRRI